MARIGIAQSMRSVGARHANRGMYVAKEGIKEESEGNKTKHRIRTRETQRIRSIQGWRRTQGLEIEAEEIKIVSQRKKVQALRSEGARMQNARAHSGRV